MSNVGPPAVTRDNFVTHGKGCQVYDSGTKYAAINSEAIAKGTSIQAELKARGFADYSSFYLSCERFPLRCWPSAFADLGSGAVLYFQFLAFCALFLFLAFLVQLAPVISYYNTGRLTEWNFSPGGFDTTDIDHCNCAGTNEGFTGLNSSLVQQDYGKRCHTWDLEWCQLGDAGPYAQGDRGKWCCRSWCYASKDCPNTKDAGSPSLSNRMLQGKNLVRSYYGCPQPDVSVCSVGSGMDNDVAYPYDSFVEDTVVPERILRLTGPGNLGPDNGESSWILVFYFLLLLIFFASVVVAYQYQIRTLALVDQRTTMPRDFAIMVENLPATATDESAILEFFRENAVPGKTDTEIVKVVIGWESAEYRENMRILNRLKRKMLVSYAAENVSCLGRCLEACTSMTCIGKYATVEPLEDIVKQLTEVQTRIRQSAPDMAKGLVSSGTVVVIFRHQEDLRQCLRKWSSISSRWLYKEPGGYMDLLWGDDLPTFFFRKLAVQKAPNPSDINWVDLGVTKTERLKRFLKTNGFMFLLIVVCFWIVYGLQKLKEYYPTSFVGSICPVIGIAVANSCLVCGAKRFGEDEYHNTLTEQTASISLKMAVAMVVNTAGVIFWSNFEPKEWYKTLIDDIWMLLAFTAVFQPFMFLLDIKYSLLGYFKRKKLTDEQLDEWNSVLQSQTKPTTKAELVMMQRQKAQVVKQIQNMKKNFEPSELEMTKRYAYAVRTFVCCILYCPLMPAISLVGIIGLGVQYWVDKYMLLRWHKRPAEPYAGQQAIWSLMFLRYSLAFFLPVATFVFIHPSWKERGDVLAWLWPSLALAVIFCAIPLSVSRTLLCLRFLPGLRGTGFKVMDSNEDNQDYYKAQHLWSKEMKYHKSQFLYAMVPEAKNPEFLKPGVSDALKPNDLQIGAAAAALAAASGAKTGTDDTVASGTNPSPAAPTGTTDGGSGAASGCDPAAATGGGDPPAAPDADPAGGGQASTTTDSADAADASTDKDGTDTVPTLPDLSTPPPIWVFETSSGWAPFDDGCQAYIEQKYQEKLNGGQARVVVTTQDITVSIDFDLMTQKAGGHGRVRNVRRQLGSPAAPAAAADDDAGGE